MVVTWTRVTNPPPAGNITLADDTEVDGSEGVVSHAGGYIRSITAATPYYLKILEDAELDQAGGTVTMTYGPVFLMEPGGILTFSGSDDTYTFNIMYSGLIARGSSTKECYIRGIDDTHRMAYPPWNSPTVCRCYYTTFNNICSYIYLSTTVSNCGCVYFEHCTFHLGSGAQHVLSIGYHNIYLKNCIIGDAYTFRVFYRGRLGLYVLEDCTINQSELNTINSECYASCFIYNTITWTNITPGKINSYPLYPSVIEVECKKLSVVELNTLSDCMFSVIHNKYKDIEDVGLNTSTLSLSILELIKISFDISNSRLTDVTGQASVVIPHCFKYGVPAGGALQEYDISKSGSIFYANDQYALSLSKPGYRTQTTTLWGSSDQTWNVTLQPQSDFDDIMDILGTPADFGSGDTIADNLKDLADDNGGADYDPATDSLEVISDKLTDVEALIDNMVVFGQITGPQHPVLDGSSSYYITMTDLTGAQIPSGAVTATGDYMVMRWNSGTSTWDMIETDSLWAGDGVLTIDPVFSSVDWADGDIYMIMTDGLTIVTLDGDTFQKPGMVFYGMVGGDDEINDILNGVNTIEADLAVTHTISDEILDLLENPLITNRNTSELWLYDDTGTNVIKRWPLRDKSNKAVVLQGTGPANRLLRTL